MTRHGFDGLSFGFGLLFAGVGLVLLGGGAVRPSLIVPWVGPVVAVAIGVVLVIAATPRRTTEPPAEGTDAAGGDH